MSVCQPREQGIDDSSNTHEVQRFQSTQISEVAGELERPESGVILPLFLLLLPVVILFIAFAFDLSRWVHLRRAEQHFAQLGALAGLQSWMANNGMAGPARLAQARTRVQNAIGTNTYIGNTAFQPIFHPNNPTLGAVITPGYWFFNAATIPAGFNRFTPADANGVITVPGVAPNPPTILPANAMLIQGRISDNATSRPFLLGATLTNWFFQPAGVQVIAAVTPRLQAFLVDATPNMTQQTHIRRSVSDQGATPALGHGSRYAFFLTADNGALGSTVHQAHWDFLTSASSLGLRSSLTTAFDLNPVVHTRDDYRRILLWNDDSRAAMAAATTPPLDAQLLANPNDPALAGMNLSLGTTRRFFRIDHFSPNQNRGPSPLLSIFAGISTAIQAMETQSVAGDQVCLVIFDNTLMWSRIIPCTSNLTGVRQLLDLSGANLTDPEDPTTQLANDLAVINPTQSAFRKAMRRNWFPNPNSFTDMQLAYDAAIRLMNNAGGDLGVTRNSITFITDGMNNVSRVGATAVPGDTWANHVNSVNQLQTLVQTTAGTTNTSVNVIMLGPDIGTNTVELRAMNSDRCMTPEEMRRAGIQETSGGDPNNDNQNAYQNRSVAQPFQSINPRMARLAQMTGGIFAPILRGGPGSGCVPRVYGPGSPCPMNPTPQTFHANCLSQEQQIQAVMPNIIGANPYTLVHVATMNVPLP